MSFTIMNLSQDQADCFLIVLENKNNEQITILVDGNRENSDYQNIQALISQTCERLDIIVVSHVDDDHLGGIIKMLEDPKWECAKNAKILYNHVAKRTVSYEQAKIFEELIGGREIISSYMDRWINVGSFLNILTEEDRRNCKEIEKNKDTKAFLTLIKPFHFNMGKVQTDCKRTLDNEKKANAGLINRNSFVFLLEFEGKSAIFTGDATWKQIEITLNKILPPDYVMDFIKIPHHGAEKNCAELADYAGAHATKYFLVTGKKDWDKKHPAENLMKEIIEKSPDAKIYTEVEGIPGKNITKGECKIEK